MNQEIDDCHAPILGEFVWHSVTNDPTILEISDAHFNTLVEIVERHRPGRKGLQILEVAAYAHITGYQLADRLGARVTMFDIAASTLRLGVRVAREHGIETDRVRRVAGDFHCLPFEDEQFDVVYICSALHHTWRWRDVLGEMKRVLAPGGLLFLENEPCLREFCLYKFRTNRPSAFLPFERKLEGLGLIRTIAEPYLGSRPETLFGMVENQQIGLSELCSAVSDGGRILESTVTPEICMGELEREMIARQHLPETELTEWLAGTLKRLCSEAEPLLDSQAIGTGCVLPDTEELQMLAARAAALIHALPRNVAGIENSRLAGRAADLVRSLPQRIRAFAAVKARLRRAWMRFVRERSPDGAGRNALASLFGASVRLLAEKSGNSRITAAGRLKGTFQEDDGVIIAFPPNVAAILSNRQHLFPDFQTASEDEVHAVFPAGQWEYSRGENGVATVRSLMSEPTMLVRPGACGGKARLLFRAYIDATDGPTSVALLQRDREIATWSAHVSESRLLSAQLDSVQPGDAPLRFRITAAQGSTPTQLALSYAVAVIDQDLL